MKNEEFDPEAEKEAVLEDVAKQEAAEKAEEDKLAGEIGSAERMDQLTDEAEQREQVEKDEDK